jgi:sugar-specific transcriptional regulator TrmB
VLNSQEQLQFLTRLGFTTNLARIYLTLVKSTPCTAYQIAKTANLASEVVYRSMPKLQKMGLVEKIVKTPVEYKAVPIDVVIDSLLEQKDRENAELKNKSAELIASISLQHKSDHTDDFKIMLVPEREQHVWFTKDRLAAVKNSLDVVITSHKFSSLNFINRTTFCPLLDRGVTLRFVISCIGAQYPLRTLNDLPESSLLKIRFISGEIPACIGISDGKEALINAPVKTEFMQSPVYWSNIPCIVGLCKTYFETYWKRATKQNPAKSPIKTFVASGNPNLPIT